MNKHEAYAAWAPEESPWSVWAKPVVFAHMMATPAIMDSSTSDAGRPNPPPNDHEVFVHPAFSTDLAVILDLPGDSAVAAGLRLAAIGFRPVPLYNAAPAPLYGPAGAEAVLVRPILIALQAAAPALSQFNLSPNAPPVFLMDANRRTGDARSFGRSFDNRSLSLPTDFPSASFLLGRGIKRVLLVQHSPHGVQQDLAHTLLRYQQAGLEIELQPIASVEPPKPLRIATPRWYRWSFQRLLAAFGFVRHPLGGFGGTLPDPSVG